MRECQEKFYQLYFVDSLELQEGTMLEVEDVVQKDSVFGDFDCNDNTPVLQPQIEHKVSPTKSCEVPHNKSATASPVRSGSRCSSTSDQNSIGNILEGAIGSPEDTLNNDFYYDDEFAVPFDANLADEVDMAMLDSVDIKTLLSLSRISDDNGAYGLRMVNSKSDTCLYRFGPDLCDSQHDGSQSFSMSDKDCVSSSEMSDLARSEPLFTPPQDGSGHHASLDSLSRADTLSGSFMSGDEKYQYDYSANKNQYMLSFDRSPSQRGSGSDEDSYHETHAPTKRDRCLTDWASKASNDDLHGQTMWGSKNAMKIDSSTDTGSRKSSMSNSSRGTPGSGTSGEGSLTTWKQLREKTSPDISEGMTTWKSLKEAHHKTRMEITEPRSKSLPDLKTRQLQAMEQQKELNAQDKKNDNPTTSEAAACNGDVELADVDDEKHKRYSASLFELFQRMKSNDDDLDINEAMVSPSNLTYLTEAWSMSPGSSIKSQVTPTEQSEGAVGMTSWSTMKNLDKLHLIDDDEDSLQNNSPHHICSSRNSSISSQQFADFESGLDNSMTLVCSRDNLKLDNDDVLEIDPLSGPNFMMQSITSDPTHRRHCGSQFPPLYSDSSVQTSFEDEYQPRITKAVSLDMMNKSLQTSVHLHVGKDCGTYANTSDAKPSSCNNIETQTHEQSLQKGENELTQKLSRSVFYTNRSLPDLSFLNKGMTQSAGSDILAELYKKPQPVFVTPKMTTMDINNRNYARVAPYTMQAQIPGSVDSVRNQYEADSRDSSPARNMRQITRTRSDSVSTNSNASLCSSSSSGIDPGSYDSQGNRMSPYFTTMDMFGSPGNSCNSTMSESSTDCGRKTAMQNIAQNRVRNKMSGHQNKGPVLRGNHNCGGSCCQQHSHGGYREEFMNSQNHCGHYCQTCGQPGFNMNFVPKVVDNVCSICKHNMNCNTPRSMTLSHPGYSEPCFTAKGRLRDIEYLQVSPTHHPSKKFSHHRCQSYLTCSCGCSSNHASPKHHRSHSVESPSRKNAKREPRMMRHHKYVHERSHSAPVQDLDEGDQRKPLKSCLVKRRDFSGMKYRSVSDPYDLAVMKYSQEGQTRYELITPPSAGECIHSLSMGEAGYTSLPPENASKAFVEKVNKKLSLTKKQSTETEVKNKPDQEINANKLATPPNSPDLIPSLPCPCQTQPATTSSVEEGEGEGIDGLGKAKKSVSFSEEVSYHSPHTSPHTSPKKQSKPGIAELSARLPAGTDLQARRQGASPVKSRSLEPLDLDSSHEAPPCDFMVSPTRTHPPGYLGSDMEDITRKKEMILEVMRGAEIILEHFSHTRDPMEKVKRGSTAQNGVIGQLVLDHMCKALYALLLDGLKPHVRSLFGKMKNNVWRVVEDSAEPGPSTRVIHELVKDLKSLDFLSTTWLKFNAFVFGLMNHKALDFWLTYIHCHEKILAKHFTETSLMVLSNSTIKSMFMDMTMALQPLAQLPFRLEYNLEYRILYERHQQQLADYMLNKHVARGPQAHLEGQRMLYQRENMQRLAGMVPVSHASQERDAKELLQMASAHLLGKLSKQKNNLSLDSLGSMLPLNSLLNRPAKLRQAHSVPCLHGVNDSKLDSVQSLSESDTISCGSEDTIQSVTSVDRDSEESVSVTLGPQPVVQIHPTPDKSYAVPIMKNNEILSSELEDNSAGKKEGFLSKLSKQFKELASPEKVYKKGITEYSFEGEVNGVSCEEAKERGARKNFESASEPKVQRVPNGLTLTLDKRSVSLDGQPVSKNIVLLSDGRTTEVPDNIEFHIPARKQQGSGVGSNGQWSSPDHSTGSLKKSWSAIGSSFGAGLIQVFDKLLLDEQKGTTRDRLVQSKTSPITPPQGPGEVSARPSDWTLNTVRGRNQRNPNLLKMGTASLRIGQQKESSLQGKSEEGTLDLALPSCLTDTDAVEGKEQKDPEMKVEKQSIPITPTGNIPPIKPNTRYIQALCHQLATEEDQLSFEKGNIMEVLDQVSSDWLLCRHMDSTGLVHEACVQTLSQSQLSQFQSQLEDPDLEEDQMCDSIEDQRCDKMTLK